MRDLVTIPAANPRTRVILGAFLIAVIALGWFGIRWQLGGMLAALTPTSDPNAEDLADAAMSLVPGDPLASWLRASVGAGDLSMFENAVRLSPYDFRWHIELGRAYERADRLQDAETELRKATDLAPTYAYPRWQLGNFLLRQGRDEEGFAELKKAALNNHTYREQVFSLAYDYFEKDASKVEMFAPETPEARAALALFLAARGKGVDALRIWNSLSAEKKAANPQFATLIARGLYSQRVFPQALEFFRQLGVDPDARAEAVTNPGFERTILPAEESPFGWQIARNDAKLEITADSNTKHSGSRGLRVGFRNYAKPDLANVFQIVAVEPNRSYRLTFWVLTENLKTSGPPLLQVFNANDDKVLAASKPFPTGSSDWQQVSLDLKTPENCNGIRIQTSRVGCGDQCPIVGTFWYDDFELTAQ